MNKLSTARTALKLAAVTLTGILALSQSASAQGCAACAAPMNVLAQARTTGTATAAQAGAALQLPINEGQGMNFCCPLALAGPFAPYFAYDQLPGKNMMQSYGLKFLHPASLDAQMIPYAIFAGSVGSGLVTPGWVANSILLKAEIKKVSAPSVSGWNTGAYVGAPGNHALRGWWANGSGIWNGPSVNGVPFDQEFNDGKAFLNSVPGELKPNQWYMLRISLFLAEQRPNDPKSWNEKEITCNNYRNRYVAFRWDVSSFKSAPGAAKPDLQFVDVK